MADGYIYIITFDGIYYKIGKATHLARRLSELQIAHPLPLKSIVTIAFTAPIYKGVKGAISKAEKLLHNEFKSKHFRGEWFRLNNADVLRIPNTVNEISKYFKMFGVSVIHISRTTNSE